MLLEQPSDGHHFQVMTTEEELVAVGRVIGQGREALRHESISGWHESTYHPRNFGKSHLRKVASSNLREATASSHPSSPGGSTLFIPHIFFDPRHDPFSVAPEGPSLIALGGSPGLYPHSYNSFCEVFRAAASEWNE
jgi:hypothetical protein